MTFELITSDQLLQRFADSTQATRECIASMPMKVISKVELGNDDVLRMWFADGDAIAIYDTRQDCCEVRYMRTDDDLTEFAGATLMGFEVKPVTSIDDGVGDQHEIQFFEIRTSRGSITMASHNEHNGYYGGFSLSAERIAA